MLSAQDLKDLFAENTPDRVVLKARKLASKGKQDQAVQLLKEAVGRMGEIADLRLELATMHFAAGRPREAGEAVRALLKADPGHASKVEEFMGWARSQYADTEALYEPMAEAHVARRNFTAAVDCLERVNKKTLESLLEGRLANLNRFLEKGSQVPRSALTTLYLAALGYEALSDWAKALDCYQKVLAAQPSEFPTVDERLKGLVARNYRTTPLRLAYGALLERLAHPERAREEFLKALEVDPRCAPQVDRFIQAGLQSSPDDESLLWDAVRVRMAEGSLPEALRLCEQMIERGSRLAEIEKLIEELSGSGKESVETLLLLAKVSLAQGKAPRAVAAVVSAIANDAGQRGIDLLERIREKFPDEKRPYQILADHHFKEGRTDACLDVYRALWRVDPSSAATIASRLQAVLLVEPDNAAALQMIEDVSIETGDPRASVPFLRRRLRRGPAEAADVASRLRPMLLAAPTDPGCKLAAAEAALASGDSAGAWSFVQDLIDPARPAETSVLRLVVLCAGDSAEMLRKVFSFITARAPGWVGQPEVIFAAGEAAARAGEIGEALDRFRAAAAASPEGASVCHTAIRRLWESFKQMRARGGPGFHDQATQICALLAEALLDAGDPAAAAETIRAAGGLTAPSSARLADKLARALKSDPTNLGLRGALAEVSLACGQVGRALEIVRAGLAGREDPASAPLTMTYGDALAQAGKPAEATRAYATAARRDPGLLEGAIERLRKVIESDRSIETAHLALGRMLAHTGRVEEGVAAMMTSWALNGALGAAILKDLERAGRAHPGEPCIGLACSRILLGQNEPAAAAAALGALAGQGSDLIGEVLSGLEEIVATHASCAQAHLELGRAYLVKRWAARACESLVRAHDLDRTLADQVSACLSELQRQFPDEPEPHIARGRLYEAQGRGQQAAEAWFKAVSVGGASAQKALDSLQRLCMGGRTVPGRIHLIRAGACRVMGAMNDAVDAGQAALHSASDLAAEVRAEMDRIIAILPAHAGARLVRASACIRLMDMQASSEDLGEAIRLDPGCAGKVASLAREIVQRQPGFPPAVRVLADSLARGGDTAGALQCLDSALSTTQGRRDLNLILARRTLALAAGDSAAARELLARAEAVAKNRDDLLDHLHREALATGRDPSAAPGVPDEIRAALARADYALAGALVEQQPNSPLRAWVLERGGRPAEAAACLRELLRHADGQDRGGLAGCYARLHDRWVARELEGRAPALMAETVVRFDRVAPGGKRAARAARAAAGAEGGER